MPAVNSGRRVIDSPQEREHGDDDQQSLESLPEENGEAADEGRGGAVGIRRKRLVDLQEQAVEGFDLRANLGRRTAVGDH